MQINVGKKWKVTERSINNQFMNHATINAQCCMHKMNCDRLNNFWCAVKTMGGDEEDEEMERMETPQWTWILILCDLPWVYFQLFYLFIFEHIIVAESSHNFFLSFEPFLNFQLDSLIDIRRPKRFIDWISCRLSFHANFSI